MISDLIDVAPFTVHDIATSVAPESGFFEDEPVDSWEDIRDDLAIALDDLVDLEPRSRVELHPLTGEGWVYFARAGASEHIKIGYTKNGPTSRFSALQTGCPHELVLEHAVDGDLAMEKSLHAALVHRQSFGEWFELTVAEAATIADRARRGLPIGPDCPTCGTVDAHHINETEEAISWSIDRPDYNWRCTACAFDLYGDDGAGGDA